MIIEIGHYALVLALAIAIILSVVPVIGARRGDQAMMDVAPLRLRPALCPCRLLLRGADLCACRLGFLRRRTSGRIRIRWCR